MSSKRNGLRGRGPPKFAVRRDRDSVPAIDRNSENPMVAPIKEESGPSGQGKPPKGLSSSRISVARRKGPFLSRGFGAVVMVKLVDFAQDQSILLLRFHLDDHGQHAYPHRRVCHEPDRRCDENREDRTRKDVPHSDLSQALRSTICVAIEDAARKAMSRNLLTQRSWIVT